MTKKIVKKSSKTTKIPKKIVKKEKNRRLFNSRRIFKFSSKFRKRSSIDG